jgi:WD40 repeat protein
VLDGKTLATGSHDRTIKLWNLAEGTEVAALSGHHNWISSLRATSDGKTLATGSHDRTVKLWNLETKQEATTLGGYKSTVWSVAFSPVGQLLATGSHNDSLKLWRQGWVEAFPHAAPAAQPGNATASAAK